MSDTAAGATGMALPFRPRGIRWTPILLAFGTVLLLVGLSLASMTMISITDDTNQVEHTLEVEASINRVAALNEQLETARRGYLIEADPIFTTVLDRTSQPYADEIDRLARLVTDNPEQVERVKRIRELSVERETLIERLLTSPSEVARIRDEAADFDSDRGVQLVREIRGIAARMGETEEGLLRVRNQRQLDSLVRFYLVGGTSLLLLFAVLGTVIVLIMRYNRELTATQAELEAANEGLEQAVGARTTELVRANQEIQRFAYIVSHDLRSPLVNVLGFTAELDEARRLIVAHLSDLYERHPALRSAEAWTAADEDLPEAIGFIRTSTEKMDRLINSILQLSRQGRRQLAPQMLELDALVEDIFATLHQRAQDAETKLIAEPLPELVSDRLAVEQILTNLIENAIKYGKPGQPGQVTVTGERRGPIVNIDVTDNGRGIDPKDHERIFELFRRSGTQDRPGEGIGLAHVRAMAYRLGGNVTVESVLDHGATFRLSLPAQFKDTEVTQ